MPSGNRNLWIFKRATPIILLTGQYIKKKKLNFYSCLIDHKQRRLQLVAGQVMGGGPHHTCRSHSLPRTTGVADLHVHTGKGAPWTRRYSGLYFMAIKSCLSFHPYHLITVVLHTLCIVDCCWFHECCIFSICFIFGTKSIKFL